MWKGRAASLTPYYAVGSIGRRWAERVGIGQEKESIGILVRTGSNAKTAMDSDKTTLYFYLVESYML